MKLGCFSVSLSVKDLQVSKGFYEKLGFEVFGGAMEHNYLIMKNGDTNIGLFRGMFEENILPFNPGWDQSAQPLKEFEDVRELKKKLQAAGLDIQQEAGEADSGHGSFVTVDPDGNAILIDQHV